jgi:hypothetical protein
MNGNYLETPNNYVEQVGGKHYNAGDADQHWDVMERHDIDYLTATATKYLMRWRKKGTPRLDLGKAASYVEKAIKCRPGQGARRLAPEAEVDAMCLAAGVHWMDGELIKSLLCSGSHQDYVATLARVQEMEANAS